MEILASVLKNGMALKNGVDITAGEKREWEVENEVTTQLQESEQQLRES